jgi:hypothetical protein
MKRATTIFIIGILTITKLFGQTDSLKNEILKYKDEKSETILKGRKLTLDKFIENDKNKVSELLEFLQNEENEDYLIFYPAEKWLLYYWTQQYQKVLKGVQDFDSTYIAKMNRQIKPQSDLMLIKIKEKLFQQRPEIKHQIFQSGLTEEEKSFLALNFDFLLLSYDNKGITQDTLNVFSKKYLQDYPNSNFDNYVRKYIRYEFEPSKWGLAFEFFSGYGVFTHNLKKCFKNNIPIGIAFDICYKKFILYLRNYIGFSKTKDSIQFKDGTWRKDAQVRVFLPEASLGYATIDNRFFKVAPFVGISSTDISPTDYDKKKYPEYENIELTFTTTYTLGLNLDFKLGSFKKKKSEPSYGFVRVRYAYNKPQFNWKYNGFDGDFHYLTIGVGGFIRGIKRIY